MLFFITHYCTHIEILKQLHNIVVSDTHFVSVTLHMVTHHRREHIGPTFP